MTGNKIMNSEFQNQQVHTADTSNAMTPNSQLNNTKNEELTATEIQILRATEKLEKLKEKAAKEKKRAEEKHEKEILVLIKKSGLLKYSKEEWKDKIEEVKMVFELK